MQKSRGMCTRGDGGEKPELHAASSSGGSGVKLSEILGGASNDDASVIVSKRAKPEPLDWCLH